MLTRKEEEKLLTWLKEKGRSLPWREEATPYHVYLSEIMLQQTRVEAVRAYYYRFLEAFPTLKDLASSSEDEVLKLWQGLGYYSRGRNLRKTAILIEEKYGGEFPKSEKDLLSLPGIGPYTAHAILAIAYSLPYVAFDGNLLRIYARREASSLSSEDPKIKEKGEKYFSSLISLAPKEGNEALMDLGETICLPNGKPDCLHCPLKEGCLAHQKGEEEKYPIRPLKKERRKESRVVFLLSYQDKYVLDKRPPKGLLASLYEFPNFLEEENKTPEEILEEHSLSSISLDKLSSYKHIFSHLEWNMDVYQGELKNPPQSSYLLLNKEEIRKLSIPSAFAYVLNYLV